MSMSMSSTQTTVVGVTGATGRIGGVVAEILRRERLHQRLLVRDPSRLPSWARPVPGPDQNGGDPTRVSGPVEVAIASYGDLDAARRALTGVDVLLMVSASESEDRLDQHRALIDAARLSGVRHVVYTSFLGAAPDATFTLARTHWHTEEHLRRSGMGWTFLRDSFYLDFLPGLVVDGLIAGPAGEGRVGAVARADVARCAAAVLLDVVGGSRRHAGRTYQLTGPEALTLAEVARTLTDVTGRPTSYEHQDVEQAYAARVASGAPQWQLDAWVSTYTAIAAGELATLTDDVQRLTGRPPLSLRELLQGRD